MSSEWERLYNERHRAWRDAMDRCERMESVVLAAREWIAHLEKSGRYLDGIPGELMDAIERLEDANERE